MGATVALIPANNEALTVREVVDETIRYVDRVIVLDDGSTDGTAETLKGSGAEVIRHKQNLGKGTRLEEGLTLAFEQGAEFVVTLDADRQHDPAEIPRFLEMARNNPNALVLGDRSSDMGHMPAYRRRAIKFGNFFIGWACGRPINDAQCGMRSYPASMWTKTQIPQKQIQGFRFETAILMHAASAGIEFAYVPIRARYEGFVMRPSHFDPLRDFLSIFGLVTSFLVHHGFKPKGLLRALGIVR